MTFLETPFNNGIFESQVKTLICRLKNKYKENIVIELNVSMFALYITKRGIDLQIKNKRNDVQKLVDEFNKYGIKVNYQYIYLPTTGRYAFHLNMILLPIVVLFSLPSLVFKLYKDKPDIIHCRSYPAALMAALSTLFKRKVKIIFDMRGLYPEEGVAQGIWDERSVSFKLWKKIEKWIMRRSEKIIVLSDTFAEYVAGLDIEYNKKITNIPASVDEGFLKIEKEERENIRDKMSLEGKYVFVSHGTLNYWHSPDILADVFSQIKKYVKDAHLLILSSYGKEKLEYILKKRYLNAHDYTINYVPYNEVPKYLTASDYAIIPSMDPDNVDADGIKHILETMIGLKVSECLASGLPLVVNRNIGGLRSIMRNNDIGVSFDVKQIGKMQSEIRDVIARREAMSNNCKIFASMYLNIEHATERYYAIYEEMMI
jgi:glycosyltransferase involved in cell wall biosynthesis